VRLFILFIFAEIAMGYPNVRKLAHYYWRGCCKDRDGL